MATCKKREVASLFVNKLVKQRENCFAAREYSKINFSGRRSGVGEFIFFVCEKFNFESKYKDSVSFDLVGVVE